jgi:CHASE2 domain-containing sensor protein
MKQLGWLQSLELRLYDRMVRYKADGDVDPRLLIVAITEADIRTLQRVTPSDETLAQALDLLMQHDPTVVGLDLHRDVPQEPGSDALERSLDAASLIAITKLGNDDSDRVPPPPAVAPDRVGFSDLLVDEDGVVRRNLLFGSTTDGSTYPSFSLLLAMRYLAQQNIHASPSAENAEWMQLGEAVFRPLESNSGAYQQLDARGYQVLMAYRSRDRMARMVTLTQVLNQQVNPEWVRNKIVLVGTTAPSGKDLFYTPYSAGEQITHQMPGVIIHAQMVSQLLVAALEGRGLIWFWTDWQEGLWVLGWTALSGAIAWGVRHPLILGLCSAGVLAGLAGASFSLYLAGGWVPVMAPAIASVMAFGAVVSYRAQQAQRQQQMVMTLLGQNTSPEIANALWQSRDRLLQSGKLPGQRLMATMLFTDIKGFSGIAEQLPPEALLEWLNEYLEAMTQEIQRHQGIVNKFTGDGLLAVFGVPVPRLTPEAVVTDAYRAVSCALAMGKRLQQLNQDWARRDLFDIQMRVGIFTGPVVVGSLGGKARMEYGVIGDAVNTASRLESCVKERQVDLCRILIAEDTLGLLGDRFLVESWGPMALAGKQHPTQVYRVIDHAALTAETPLPSVL